MTDPATPPKETPAEESGSPAVALTPHGTPIVIPGAPKPTGAAPTLSPEMAGLLTAALNTLPPGAGAELLKKNWGYVVALLLPLLLTTYQNIKDIWAGPATLTAITETATKDRKAVEEVKTQLDAMQKKAGEIEVKLDKVLWILNQRPGLPSSGPSF